MDKKEFSLIHQHLGKTQKQMAQLLGTSPKAIQSFEQGWRNVPTHIERQVLFLMALKYAQKKMARPCWVIKRCSEETRHKCPAREFQTGHLCWFINGTICQGEMRESWHEKMKLYRQCKVFASLCLPIRRGDLPDRPGPGQGAP
ncbi:MAG: helix-turn-helix transcriptional regulator [Syntrophorhabdales bacterium]|jgi:DNA-binding XRE family transcriptional regulator